MTGQRIGGHESTHRTAEVPSPEVVEARLAIAFFAGEFVGSWSVLARGTVHTGQCVVGVAQIRRDLCSLHFAFFEQAFIHHAQDLFLSLGKRYQSAQFESAFWIA